MEPWVEFNRKYSEAWPVIVTRKDPLPGAEEKDGESGKLEKYFSESPGEGG
jgi:ferredoxin